MVDKNFKFCIVRDLTQIAKSGSSSDVEKAASSIAASGASDEAIGAFTEYLGFLTRPDVKPSKSSPARASWKQQKDLCKSIINSLQVAKAAQPDVTLGGPLTKVASAAPGSEFTDEALASLPKDKLTELHAKAEAQLPGARPKILRAPEIPVNTDDFGFPIQKQKGF